MGHRFTTVCGRGLVTAGLGVVLALAVAPPAGAARATDDPPMGSDSGGTLLPPDGGVSIVPTDQAPDGRVAPRTSPDPDSSSGLELLDAAALGLAALASLAATGIGLSRLARTLYAWRSPASLAESAFGPAGGEPTTSFSLLVPAGRSDTGLGETLDQLAALDHPHFEVIAVVGYDDLTNRAAAGAAAVRHPETVQVFVDRQRRRSRAASLNQALDECQGEVVGVFQPGACVHPRLLLHVDAALADPEIGALQGGIRHEVGRRRWFSARAVVDQYFWSRSRLHFHARQRFLPLEATTAFVRWPVLREAGGWDERCVDEGSELGVRLSARGTAIAVAYGPDLATVTPAPATLPALLRVHYARIRGYLQVLRKGEWRQLPSRRQRLLARSMLVRPLLDAVTTLAVVGTLATLLAIGAPAPAVLLAALPLVPVPIMVGAELAGLGELARVDGRRPRTRDWVWLVVSFVPVTLLTSGVALWALLAQLRGRVGFERSMPVVPVRSPDRLVLSDDAVVDLTDIAGSDAIATGGGRR